MIKFLGFLLLLFGLFYSYVGVSRISIFGWPSGKPSFLIIGIPIILMGLVIIKFSRPRTLAPAYP